MGLSQSPGDRLAHLANGIEAGVIGGLAMLLLMVSASLLHGHPWIEVPNLLGSTFYGSRAFRQGAGLATISGIALHFVITGSIGAAFGAICGGVRERRRLVLLGLIAGIVWYYLADAVFWSRVNPRVPLYSPQPATWIAHALFGACLGFMGRRLGLPMARPISYPPPLPKEAAESFTDALE